MRIYGKFENVGSEYDVFAPVKISLKPIEGICMYLDLEEGKEYESTSCEIEELEDWKMYNGRVYMGEYLYNPQTKEYINSRIIEGGLIDEEKAFVKLEDGRIIYEDEEYNHRDNIIFTGGYESIWHKYQKYKEGKPIGEPEFEEIK